MRTFSILTLGCKVNSYESEALINKLLDFVDQQFFLSLH